ncbi:GNAT superfamily N-acetyltransferase [Nocardia kruczakiae]|uniref:GNAT superfamily N-acetyltransferase n=1 Tax=Nocardia kruczakiae TaxID=261477 RepID=A0ABU1XDL0_9NOCA|nr:GNAT family N-acetyltransferase [Nocardia kruczakiae]MDR7168616.1 GNAT superfamily N-acetyltransferase [Nocardia kruczakiae]
MDQWDTRVRIRRARTDDFAAIAQLTVDTYVGEGHVHPESPYVAELSDTETRAREAEVLVAERDGDLLGSLTIARPGTLYADIARAGELEFRMLAVAKRARGAGVGTALVRTVVETARAENFAAVVLTTMPGMADARRIYQRMGFGHVLERDWHTDAGLPLTVMRLALTPGA